MEFPLAVYLSCYDILRTTGELAPAEQLLGAARALLEARATAITDPAMRESLLNNVALNRRVLAYRER
jgi:hypothetical protein